MKRGTILLFCALLILGNLKAQKLRTGVSVSTVVPIFLSVGYGSNSNANLGFNVALKEEYEVNKYLGISIGVENLNWGVEFDSYYYYDYPDHKGKREGYLYHHKLRLNEILTPVLIKLDTDKLFGDKALYISFGGLLRFNFGSTTKVNANWNSELLYSGPAGFRYRAWEIAGLTIVSAIGIEYNILQSRHRYYSELAVYHTRNYFLYTGKNEYPTNDMGIDASSISLTFGTYF